MSRLYLILGPSGRGKTTSLEKLDRTSTVLFNLERKALPFQESASMRQKKPKTVKEFDDLLVKAKSATDMKTLVIDSFSAFSDLLWKESSIVYSGWDIVKAYNLKIMDVFTKVKDLVDQGVDVIIIGHDETLDEGKQKRLKVKGKEWEGLVEKEFDTVLWANVVIEANKSNNHQFITQTDGIHPAKSPRGMLPPTMPNDMAEVLRLAHLYDDAAATEKIEEALSNSN